MLDPTVTSWENITHRQPPLRKRHLLMFRSITICTIIILIFANSINSACGQASLTDGANEAVQSWVEINEGTAPVRTERDLHTYLSSNTETPFDELSANERSSFIASLQFTERGLASYSAIPLRRLSLTSAYRLLAIFGLQDQAGMVTEQTPRNPAESSIKFLGDLAGSNIAIARRPPIRNKFCLVGGGKTQCKYEYGSYCNARCDQVQEP